MTSDVFAFGLFGDIAARFAACVRQVKDLPGAILVAEQLEGIDAAVAKGVAGIKGIITPGLGEVAIQLHFQVPNFLIPHVRVGCADGF